MNKQPLVMSKSNHWSMGLLSSMKNPEYRVLSSDIGVVIKDKFPKAKFHFLVLPYDTIPTIYHVSKCAC